MALKSAALALAVLALLACLAAGRGIHKTLDASQQLEMQMRVRNRTMHMRLMRQYGEELSNTVETSKPCVENGNCKGPGDMLKYCIKNICQEKACVFDSDCYSSDQSPSMCGSNKKCVKGWNYECMSNAECYVDECCLPELMTCDSSLQYCCEYDDQYECPAGRCVSDANCAAGQTCVDTYCKKPNPPTLKRTPTRKATPTASLKPTASRSKKITSSRTPTLKQTW
eukprot:CAMPEP_0184333762 /NCGR_PEP_ID=MMETSP1089-20130417/2724_1 /TAXON_ID=38269 ORGANISM="Gloeochaete wittrockiana, Strain SAG46.84" /NCGR_SAMPLE_ID=MMETSP1089 /ASSEMBLY_ACC=CAM_ASM_000445 /LENGTH=225 /DNA_ID=CAMNT_0026657757 /DNA_START=120 /DNA_END=794 /DNA_ORIENTATION=+